MKSYLIKLLKQVGIISLTQGKHIQFSDILYVKSEIISFPLTCHHALSSQGTKLVEGKKKKKKTEENMDFLPSELPVWIALQGQGNKGNKSICYLHISKAGWWNPLPLTGMRSPWWRWHHQVGRDSQQCLCDEIFFTRAPSSNEIRDISAAMAFLVWSHTSLC